MKTINLLVALILISISTVFAHNTGSIKGVVVDGENNQTMPGVNIIIDETIIGTVTDINGKFELKNVQIGHYKLIVSYIGYESQEINVEVKGISNNLPRSIN